MAKNKWVSLGLFHPEISGAIYFILLVLGFFGPTLLIPLRNPKLETFHQIKSSLFCLHFLAFFFDDILMVWNGYLFFQEVLCVFYGLFLLHFWWGDNKPTTKLWTDRYGDTVLYIKSLVHTTLDGWNPANQLIWKKYPIIYRVFLHPRWLSRIFSIHSSRPFLIQRILDPTSLQSLTQKKIERLTSAEGVSMLLLMVQKSG